MLHEGSGAQPTPLSGQLNSKGETSEVPAGVVSHSGIFLSKFIIF
jgi:hypothetical protein